MRTDTDGDTDPYGNVHDHTDSDPNPDAHANEYAKKMIPERGAVPPDCN
jgi:hypothetical protein